MSLWDTGVLWRPVLVVPPEEEPIEVGYLRDKHLRVSNGSVEDVLIAECIRAAREMCEQYTHRALMPQTWSVTLNQFPTGLIELPKPPLIEVLSVEYRDGADALQTVDAAGYYVSPSSAGPYGAVTTLTSWPSTFTRSDAVTVTFRAGYEDGSVSPAVPNVPSLLKAGIAVVAGELYKQRSLSVHGFGVGQSPALLDLDRLWGRYRVQLVVA